MSNSSMSTSQEAAAQANRLSATIEFAIACERQIARERRGISVARNMASTRYPEDAAAVCALHGPGAWISHTARRSRKLYVNDGTAGLSFDAVADQLRAGLAQVHEELLNAGARPCGSS